MILNLEVIKGKLRAELTKKNLQSMARFALAFAGGCFVAYGIATGRIDSETAKTILAWVTQQSGINVPATLVTTIGPVAWSMIKNRHEDKKVETALALPAGSTKDDLADAMKDGAS